MTEPVTPPVISALPPAPLITDTPAAFNDKAFPFAQALEPLRVQINSSAVASNTNAVASKEGAVASAGSATASASSAAAAAGSVTAAANQVTLAAEQVALAEEAKESAEAAAAAAGAAAGLPSLVGKAGLALTVNPTETGVEWSASSFEIGGAYMGFKKPMSGTWLDPEAVYLKASYTALATAVGVVHDGSFNTFASTLPASAIWNATAYGDGKVVSVSSTAAAASSANLGVSWTSRTMPSAGPWVGVAHGNGKFVALGTTSGVGAISSDGETWAALTLPAGSWTAINFAGGKFVIFGPSAAVATSTDGVSWTTGTMPAGTWIGCAFGNGKFVAAGSASTFVPQVATSIDGLTWTLRSLPPGAPNRLGKVAFGNGVFVAAWESILSATSVISSTDGETWSVSQVAVTNQVDIKFGNGVFFMPSGAPTATSIGAISRNGREWTIVAMGVSAAWVGIAFGEDTFVVTSRGNGVAPGTAGNVARRVKVFSFDPATQFFLPLPFNAFGAAKQWVKAA